MPTVVSESVQIDSLIYDEYKETWATPYYSGSELLALQTYYQYGPGTRTIDNTIAPFDATVEPTRIYEITREFAVNVISASYDALIFSSAPDIEPPI